MAAADVDFQLDQLVKVTEVTVVQQLDVGVLQQTLRWIVEKLQGQGAVDGPAGNDRLAALQQENNELKEKLNALTSKQEELDAKLGQKADQAAFDEVELILSGLKDLPPRVKALEDKARPFTPEAQSLLDSASGELSPIGVKHKADAAPVLKKVSESGASGPASLEQLQQKVAQLEKDVAGLADKASHGASSQSREAGFSGDSTIPAGSLADEVAALRDVLASKADAADVDTLRKRLGEKADKKELDALLQGGLGSAAGGAGGDSGDSALAVRADGSVDNGQLVAVVNQAVADLGSLRGLLVLLQERLDGKADRPAVDDVASAASGLKDSLAAQENMSRIFAKRIAALEAGSSSPAAQPAGGDGALEELRKRLQALESDLSQRLGVLEMRLAAGGGAPAAAGDAAAASSLASDLSAVDGVKSIDDLRPLIKGLYTQLSGKADQPTVDSIVAKIGELMAQLAKRGGADAVRAGMPSGVAAAGSSGGAQQGAGGEVASLAGADSGRLAEVEAALQEVAATVQDLAGRIGAGGKSGDGDGGAADAARLQQQLDALQTVLAGKADQAAVDELRLQLAAAAAGTGGGQDAGGLLQTLQGILREKASRADVDALRDQLSRKAGRDELDSVAATAAQAAAQAAAAAAAAGDGGAGSGGVVAAAEVLERSVSNSATKDELSALAQQVGDLFGDVSELRALVASMPRDQNLKQLLHQQQQQQQQHAGAPHVDTDAVMKVVNALAKELATLRDSLDLVAHAANVMAVGMEQRQQQGAQPAQGEAGAGEGAAEAAAGDGRGSPAAGANGLVGGRENRQPRGALERLIKLLGRGAFGHKMDWFDPELLNRMGQKLGMVDAWMKNPAFMRQAAVPDMGVKELESQLKRLGRDMRALRERMDASGGAATARGPEGDHAMLAGKPLLGYRCMACDRPLEKLDERPGPHVPTYQMPVRAAAAAETATRSTLGPRASSLAGAGTGLSPETSATKLKKNYAYDSEKRGPQNWYEDQNGPAGEALPREDVGPKLPPGGWRGNTTSVPLKAVPSLPDINGKQRSPTTSAARSPQTGTRTGANSGNGTAPGAGAALPASAAASLHAEENVQAHLAMGLPTV